MNHFMSSGCHPLKCYAALYCRRKPKTQRSKRYLESRESKLTENTKTAMFIRGGRTSEVVSQTLKDMYFLKKPDAVMFQKKNIMRPLEDQTSLEFLSDRNDASLFMFGSHQKKRPNNVVIGRFFDFHVLDMVELGIEKYKSMQEFHVGKFSLGSKPCLLFAGEAFENEPEYQRLKNLLIDFFRGPVIENIRLAGLEHVLLFTTLDGKIYLRNYKVQMKKSGSRTPRIELEEIGPSVDFSMRRTRLASDDLYKRARQQPKQAKPKKVKNINRDPFGSKLGRIHMEKQDLDKLQTRKMKGLKRKTSDNTDKKVEAKKVR
ncbi:ribosome production factor 2 homolog isoform X1 [Lingula anatina]|uniref:Ribosome production factor 2 homolog n=1 Tax=Lingula anatina TaxID=7574 RepID=A0A1S3HGH2_LINAN|nr:ribosome production factor 2 homolog isoform X1 [Lingula anatina]|eukprot:XP_013385183.1 ribosome production factor 2 homolog isoform X1 [Lingula anatina]